MNQAPINDLDPAQARALVEHLKGPVEAPVVIDFKTAEYLAVLLGQTNWGSQARRAQASEVLNAALGSRPLVTAQECFDASKSEGRRR